MGMLCDMLGVSASEFYAQTVRLESTRARANAALAVAMHRRFHQSDRTYGARRLWRDVCADGFAVGLRQVERVMRTGWIAHALPTRKSQQLSRRRPLQYYGPNIFDRARLECFIGMHALASHVLSAALLDSSPRRDAYPAVLDSSTD
jgi:putative transposase